MAKVNVSKSEPEGKSGYSPMTNLTISHGAWTGSYKDFTEWRNVLAKAAGYSTVGPPDLETPVIDWENFEDECFEGEWDETPDDPLLVLIVHYDDEGVIRVEQAEKLADRLTTLLPIVHRDYPQWVRTTDNFIEALTNAFIRKEDLRFG
ncbi:MAG TPA: hypothetical protein VIY48_17700 [Candidatus Paceibacterota bacterium]